MRSIFTFSTSRLSQVIASVVTTPVSVAWLRVLLVVLMAYLGCLSPTIDLAGHYVKQQHGMYLWDRERVRFIVMAYKPGQMHGMYDELFVPLSRHRLKICSNGGTTSK